VRWVSSTLVLSFALAGCAAPLPPAAPVLSETEDDAPALPKPEVISAEKARLHAAMKASLTAPDPALVPELESTRPVPLLTPLVRTGTPELPEASADGSRLPPESIRRVVRLSAGRFRECHQQASLRNRVHGRVLVRFDIGPDGRVWRAEEESATLPDREFRRCLLTRLFELEFPSPGRQNVTVRYPWAFGAPHRLDTLPDADRTAEAPPPGFEEAMQSGVSVAPPLPPDPEPPAQNARPTKCIAGDPMCSEL
jgi:hypothetical protein